MFSNLAVEQLPQADRVRANRVGQLASHQMAPQFVTAVEAFKAELLRIDVAIASSRLTEEQAQTLVNTSCDAFVVSVQQHAGGQTDLDRQNGAYAFREGLPFLVKSACIDRWHTKPRGYAGDFYTIEMMYQNEPKGDGRLGRLIDRWALDSVPARAVRNRRRMLATAIREIAARTSRGSPTLVTSLASGSARELFDVLGASDSPDLRVTCIDIDPQALAYSSELAQRNGAADRMVFAQDNVIHLSQGRGKTSVAQQHMIYSVGLIDYLEANHVVALLDWIYDQLLPGGTAVLGNFDVSNPGRAFMDHVVDWRLIHRTAEDLRELFARSKFGDTPVEIRAEDEKVNLFAFCRKQSPVDAVACLARVAFFADLSERTLQALARDAEWVFLPGGESLARPGEDEDGLVVVATGRLRITPVGPQSVGMHPYEIGPGESLGELSFLTGEPQAVIVRAMRDTVLARLSRVQLKDVFARHPQMGIQLAGVVARKLARVNYTRAEPRSVGTIAIVPLSRDVRLSDFAVKLARALERRRTVLHLNAERMDAHLGSGASAVPYDDSRYGSITSWMNEQEKSYRVVVLESSTEPSAWARRCVRQADKVVAVALTDGGPRDSEIAPVFFDAAAERGDVGIDLVLAHQDGDQRARASAAWLSLHPFESHHHLRMNSRSDFDRLARSLLGESVGLVLGGGGARCYAHIGVIRALEEAGVPIDRVGGTSLGAIIAAQYAFGYESDALSILNRRGWVDRHPVADFAGRLATLVSGKRSSHALGQWFGDARIEDLWLPFFCVSANLTRAEVVVHQRGPVAKWVQASASVPGISQPVLDVGGDLLIDGGLLNNIPVDVMRSHGAGRVIAVDVTRPAEAFFDSDRDKPRRPNTLQVLLRSTLLPANNLAKRMRAEADLCLTPPVGNFQMFDWHALEKIIAVGYSYAQRAIAEARMQVPLAAAPHTAAPFADIDRVGVTSCQSRVGGPVPSGTPN